MDFSLSSHVFYLENGHLTIPYGKNPKNLSEISYENGQNKLKTQVIIVSLLIINKNGITFLIRRLKNEQ